MSDDDEASISSDAFSAEFTYEPEQEQEPAGVFTLDAIRTALLSDDDEEEDEPDDEHGAEEIESRMNKMSLKEAKAVALQSVLNDTAVFNNCVEDTRIFTTETVKALLISRQHEARKATERNCFSMQQQRLLLISGKDWANTIDAAQRQHFREVFLDVKKT
jgi:hypothetical protein